MKWDMIESNGMKEKIEFLIGRSITDCRLKYALNDIPEDIAVEVATVSWRSGTITATGYLGYLTGDDLRKIVILLDSEILKKYARKTIDDIEHRKKSTENFFHNIHHR